MDRVPLSERRIPRYQSHKKVGALQIAEVDGCRVSFEPVYSVTDDESLQPEPIVVDPSMFARFTPGKGDWFVVYEDGFESFSPAKAFEEGYTPQGELPDRVTLDMLEKRVVRQDFFHPLQTTLTMCVLVLDNGFTVIGESACVNPAIYDQVIGRKLAREQAIEKLWQLEGYLLAERRWKAGQ